MLAYVQDKFVKIKITLLATKITAIAVVSKTVGKVQFSYFYTSLFRRIITN